MNIINKKHPIVSIIIPCYNEEKTIGLLLEAIKKQDYPQSDIEIIISDSLSTDKTIEKISEFVKNNPASKVKVIKNLKKTIPSGINSAAGVAEGHVQLDAGKAGDAVLFGQGDGAWLGVNGVVVGDGD